MNNAILQEPSVQLKDEYLSYYEEWMKSGEEIVPWVVAKDPTDFPSMLGYLLEHALGSNLPKGWVPSSTFWLLAEKRVIGVVNIRHGLNDHLLHVGGHIGYGIRPSERRKGYATKLLQLSLVKAKALGIKRALLTCDESNMGSEKTILSNGGIQDTNYVDEHGGVTHRFWIHT